MIHTSRRYSMGLALVLALAPAVGQAQTPAHSRIIAASSLPRLASDLRDEGVPAGEVATALNAMLEAGIPASDAAGVLQAEYQARIKENHPTLGFGARVRGELAKGRRGKALATAVISAQREPRRTPGVVR